MNYTTIYVGMDVHKGTFLSVVTITKKKKQNILKKLRAITVRFLTTSRPCVSITETICALYAVMKQAILGFLLYHQLTAHGVKYIILASNDYATAEGQEES